MAEHRDTLDPARMERIADELTAIRRRGLEELYLPTGSQQSEAFPEIEGLANAYARAAGLPTFGQAAAIRALLYAAIPAYAGWGNETESQTLALLFFDPLPAEDTTAQQTGHQWQGTSPRPRPTDRLDAARTFSGLDKKRFTEHQRGLFLSFAPFLDAFVGAVVREAAPQLPPPGQNREQSEEQSEEPDDDREEAAASPPPQGSRFPALLALVVAAGLVATILVLAILRPVTGAPTTQNVTPPTTITGYVKCWPDATKPVVGVWIVAGNGGSGWASWHVLPGQTNVAWFSRTLPHGGSYVVHVGCGGTPQHWELAITSITEVLGSGYTFTCYDAPSVNDPTQVSCQP